MTEIGTLLNLAAHRSCRSARELAACKILQVDAQIRELYHLRNELTRLVAECDLNLDDAICPLMQRLAPIAEHDSEQRLGDAVSPMA